MKQNFTIFFLLLLISCAPKITPIKGDYLNKPYSITSDQNKDAIWDKIIDLFAQKGISIKLVDRSSGLIVSDKTALTYSWEDTKGALVKKDAWVVIPKVFDRGSMKLIKPSIIIGDWNIRIKATPDNKTAINVNLVNIRGSYLLDSHTEVPIDGKSTGAFEQMIADNIK